MNCDSFKKSLLTMVTVMIVALVAACESQGAKTPDDVKRDLTEQMKNAECLSDIAHHPQRSSAEALRIAKDFYSHNLLRSQTNDDDFEVDYILSDNY